MTFPTTLSDLKTYVAGLGNTFPVPATQVKYGYTDVSSPATGPSAPIVVFNDYRLTAPEWTVAGPAYWVTDFTVSCFASSNAAAVTLAGQVNALLAGQIITARTLLCEFVSLGVVQEAEYRFHAQLTYRLQESN